MRAIIPAGGAGARLWPLSRRDYPKFLLDLAGTGRALVADTVLRLRPVAASTMVVTGVPHEDAVRVRIPRNTEIITELSPRDSMAAIGLAASIVEARWGGEEIVGSFAADHVIGRVDLFHETVRRAQNVARTGKICTIGIAPRFAATGFGYIKVGDKISEDAFLAADFVEKPDQALASQYLRAGYLWNAGMFVAQAGVLMNELAREKPALADGLREIGSAWDGPNRQRIIDAIWPGLEKIAIDHAIAEPAAAAGKVAVVPAPAEMGWDDVGDFTAVRNIAGEQVHLGTLPTIIADADAATFVATNLRHHEIIAIRGIKDAVVVRTEDATLVTTTALAQEVKTITEEVARQRAEAL
ncbi:MAG: sugar phosphate nucleotidyltransferase [Actinomycetaceae bacterium]|nr:sugar phosphate nucleotidyltransferase [Actinomycetaceae bacterium]